jgi:folate-binding protein YgfZ
MLTTDEWQRLQSGGAADLSSAVKLRLTGPDALRYLNGQVTNDVRRLAPGESMPACVCNHKGRLEALVQVSMDSGGTWLVTADAALRGFLPLRLEKYLIADDAAVEDVTDDYRLIHLLGSESPVLSGGAKIFAANRFGIAGRDVWLPAGDATAFQFSSTEALEALRIDRGIPAWETELTGGVLPPEARLDESAVDYYKGCYIGQEVISRIRSVGHVNRRLERLIASGGARLEAGWEIVSVAADGTPAAAGSITSAAWHPALQRCIALGFVKRNAAGGELRAGAPGTEPATVLEIRKDS